MASTDPATATPAQAQAAVTSVSVMNSVNLLGPQGALQINHKGAIYTLRATSKGGLILTK